MNRRILGALGALFVFLASTEAQMPEWHDGLPMLVMRPPMQKHYQEPQVSEGLRKEELEQIKKLKASDLYPTATAKDNPRVPMPPGTHPAPSPFNTRKPKPDQCPRCGKMAAPYHRRSVTSTIAGSRKPLKDYPTFFDCDSRTEPDGPDERITRCTHCNTAFWQDAVK